MTAMDDLTDAEAAHIPAHPLGWVLALMTGATLVAALLAILTPA